MRRLFSRAAMTLLMMLLTTASAWADPTFLTRGDGEGTEGNPYKITNANDLMDLSVYVNGSGSYSDNTTESTNHPCDGVYFQQTADINLSGSFHPIGDHVNNRSFSGHYDGGHYAITGLHVEGSYQHAGLFGRLLRATVKNVRLVSPTVISTANQGNSYAGALVGSTQTINNEAYRVTIENCLVINPTVSFTYPSTGRWVGAIVGSIGGSADYVSHCYFYDSNAAHGYAAIGDPFGTIVSTTVTRHITLGADITTTTPATNADNGFVYDGRHYYRDGLELVLETTLTDNPASGYTIAYSIDGGNNWLLNNTFTVGADIEGKTITVSNDQAFSDYETVSTGNTTADPYIINNRGQMTLLAQRVNGGKDYNGKFFKLQYPLYYDYTTANLYTPIGTADHPFRGTFDGNNQEIGYIILTASASCQGLFGHTDGATIKNVLLHDSKFTGTDQLGAVVGQAEYSTIENCTVYDTEVTATGSNAGAIVGSSTGNTLTGIYYYHTSRKTGDADAVYNNIGTAGGDVSGISPLHHILLADGIVTTTPATNRANGYVIEGKTCFRNGLVLTFEPLTASEGYTYKYFLNGESFDGNTLTVDAGCEGKTITKGFIVDKTPRNVTYMKADGTTDTHEAIPLDGSETTLTTGWYYVGSDISFNHPITTGYKADVTIVLCNGKTMDSYHFIREDNENHDDDGVFTIYGQSLDPDLAGTLNVTSQDGKTDAIIVPQYVQHSGNVIISNVTGYGIFCYNNVTVNGGKLHITLDNNIPVVAAGNIIINGGQVYVQALSSGLGFRTYSGHDIVLGWTNATTDYIYSSCYETWGDGGKIRLADGKSLTDGSTLYTNDNITADALSGKTLRPAAVVTFDNGFGVTLHSIPVTFGSVVAQPENPTLTGYTFVGWYTTDNIGPGGTAYIFSTPVNSPFTLYAKWDGVDYDISYDLAGGELPAGQSNPTTYNTGSADITLVNPVRKGYTFAGWTGTGLTAPTTTVTIATGSMASRQYTATWALIDYTISYDLADGELPAGLSNPTTFSIESDDFTLVNPVKAHYAFAGWTGYDLTGATKEVIITKGSTEDRLYTATWEQRKDFSQCTATVPNPTYKEGYNVTYFYDGSWNSNHGGIVVRDPDNNQLTYGTDYVYSTIKSLDFDDNNNPCTHVGEHCRVFLEGCGLWEGTLTADVVIQDVSGSGTWGDLAWSFADGTLTITGSGAMNAAANNVGYPWYEYGTYIKTIILDDNITTIAANAFAGTSQVNTYAGVNEIARRYHDDYWGDSDEYNQLPTKLTSIGENAFAFSGATFNLDDIISQIGLSNIGENALYKVRKLVATLSDAASNTEKIALLSAAQSADITLAGRTLFKDGYWNTLCLPFNVALESSPLKDDGVDVRTLSDASFSSGTLTLDFTPASGEGAVTEIKAGVPYIIKWNNTGQHLTQDDLMFISVKVSADNGDIVCSLGNGKSIAFRGTYAKQTWETENKNILFLGENNTLYYPQPDLTDTNNPKYPSIGAQRAYFQLTGFEALSRFVLNFGDGNGSADVSSAIIADGDVRAPGWYTLDGRRLDGVGAGPVPARLRKGLYINNGRKVVIK